jgi:dCMP deaminase
MTDWDQRFLDLAALMAGWSKDSTKVGAVAVSPDRAIVSTGYNGPPRGVRDLADRVGTPSSVNPNKLLWCAHAEENLVAQAARIGVSLLGTAVYVTHAPCSRCARMLIQAGVARVIWASGTTCMGAREFEVAAEMLAEAGVPTFAILLEGE